MLLFPLALLGLSIIEESVGPDPGPPVYPPSARIGARRNSEKCRRGKARPLARGTTVHSANSVGSQRNHLLGLAASAQHAVTHPQIFQRCPPVSANRFRTYDLHYLSKDCALSEVKAK